ATPPLPYTALFRPVSRLSDTGVRRRKLKVFWPGTRAWRTVRAPDWKSDPASILSAPTLCQGKLLPLPGVMNFSISLRNGSRLTSVHANCGSLLACRAQPTAKSGARTCRKSPCSLSSSHDLLAAAATAMDQLADRLATDALCAHIKPALSDTSSSERTSDNPRWRGTPE